MVRAVVTPVNPEAPEMLAGWEVEAVETCQRKESTRRVSESAAAPKKKGKKRSATTKPGRKEKPEEPPVDEETKGLSSFGHWKNEDAEREWKEVYDRMNDPEPDMESPTALKVIRLVAGEKCYFGFVDTGATISVMSEDCFRLLSADGEVERLPTDQMMVGAGTTHPLRLNGACFVRLNVGGVICEQKFYIANRVPFLMLIGMDFLKKYSAVIDCAKMGPVMFPWVKMPPMRRWELLAAIWDLMVQPKKRGIPSSSERLRAAGWSL
jgi:hypothetical protein